MILFFDARQKANKFYDQKSDEGHEHFLQVLLFSWSLLHQLPEVKPKNTSSRMSQTKRGDHKNEENPYKALCEEEDDGEEMDEGPMWAVWDAYLCILSREASGVPSLPGHSPARSPEGTAPAAPSCTGHSFLQWRPRTGDGTPVSVFGPPSVGRRQ